MKQIDLKKFEKYYVLDTNIILNDVTNLKRLSQENKNLIILPETVIDELDDKKTGFDEINFQAREFGRLLSKAEIISTDTSPIYIKSVLVTVETPTEPITILIGSKNLYDCETEKISRSILNDRKILEIAYDLNRQFPCIFISNDVMARTRAISLNLKVDSMMYNTKEEDTDIDFHLALEFPEFFGTEKELKNLEIPEHISSIEVLDSYTGRCYYYFRTRQGTWSTVEDKNEDRLPIPPINLKQRVLSEIILDKNDITVITGVAGTGKNLIATSAAMRLIDLNKDVFHKIYYLRRTVISGTSEDELGFLPGTLEEKTSVYNYPMEDTLKKMVTLKLKKDQKNNQEIISEKIQDLKSKYQIEYLYAGHLRGSTLDEGSILICDEIQNFSVKDIRTIFSRLGKDSIIIALGSNNQIDSKYLSKYNNALTFLLKKCGKENDSDVSVKGIKLTNVIRSKIAEYSDKEIY